MTPRGARTFGPPDHEPPEKVAPEPPEEGGVVAAIQNLDEVWLMKNPSPPEHDLALPLVIRNFISAIRRSARG